MSGNPAISVLVTEAGADVIVALKQGKGKIEIQLPAVDALILAKNLIVNARRSLCAPEGMRLQSNSKKTVSDFLAVQALTLTMALEALADEDPSQS